MGVKLVDLIPEEVVQKISLEDLRGKAIALDAYNMLYQFITIIRGVDGKPLMDRQGRITSHLSGLFFRTINFLKAGIKPIFVYDGRPPDLKQQVLEKRMERRAEAAQLYLQALEEGRVEEARKYAQQAAVLDEFIVESSKKLIRLMGLPIVQAPSEGEAQAAYLAIRGDAYASASQDMDSLLFGSPRLVRNLSIVGKRKLPGRKEYVEVEPEIIYLDKLLSSLKISREQLIDIAILVGTDYCEGVKGVGPKKALKLIKEHGTVENVLRYLNAELEVDPRKVKEIFLKPIVLESYEVYWSEPDYRGIEEMLHGEHDFSLERVRKTLSELRTIVEEERGKTSLDAWL
ncbi:MAG: flap endonuclease-1 [Aigarchaeota archaeon]|nr:flap endonuclease-1 [Aigarchaeota archaeon]MCX8192650.1 flap endonuclease-1 [Nitrososphaeria archaeon]MDW7985610.1 flap endonuclease-1 [Nitrososphaerota archaeon]